MRLKPKIDDDGKWGLADEHGEWIIQPIFDRISPFRGKYAEALKDGEKVFVDEDGFIHDEIPWFDRDSVSNGKTSRSPLDILLNGCKEATDILHQGLRESD